ncbi:substrate-binding domain-containing protein [Agromyces sp. SYSU K20354]|uniref:substrate-binding domain-containing protein n=1 Tax=Agromyces cavernae TaxID=2898659 RepID=UPI001E552641|nr:substrate-binding domain-containing protein [Agromyces cavernae]MCD2441032.1 substrate-binding domain-containing protein [Agromyces cavernae]
MSTGGPSLRRERRRSEQRARRRRGTRWIIIGAAALVLLLGGGIATALVMTAQNPSTEADGVDEAPQAAEPIVFPDDEPAAAAGASPCTTVRVLSSFENAEMVSRLVDGYNAQPRDVNGSCVTAVATKDKSGLAAEDASHSFTNLPEDQRPTVWVPDASSWIGIARATGGGAAVPAETTSLGASDIVLAMPEALAAAIGWDEDSPTWAEVYEVAEDENAWSDLGHPEWGAFKLGKTSPLVASSGEAALLNSFSSAAGTGAELTRDDVIDPEVTEEVRRHELATSHYMATPEHFLWHARQSEEQGSVADFLSAVIVDEKSVWDYNRGITSRDGVTRVASDPPAEKLVPIYPSDGFYVADNPAVLLEGVWLDLLETAAAEDFLRFALTKQGQQIVRETGYRDVNGAIDPLVAEVGQFAADPPGALPYPRGNVIRATHLAFPDVRKRAEVLFLVDVSGSMEEPIPGGMTKLAGAKAAITEALDHFTPGDNVGLAAFSAVDMDPISPGLVSPVADIGETRTEFLRELGALRPIEFTPLYAAVDKFARERAADWQPDRINAIVLLSDGKNEYFGSSVTAAQMISGLEELHHHETPVLIFTLAYGANADVATLQSISSATGAHYYDATDPTKVSDVLGDLVTSF